MTWTANCFYNKPTCYFLNKDQIEYNTQSATFSINSHGMCPDVLADVDLSAEICDTGIKNVIFIVQTDR